MSQVFSYTLEQLLLARAQGDEPNVKKRAEQLQDVLTEVFLIAGSNQARRSLAFDINHGVTVGIGVGSAFGLHAAAMQAQTLGEELGVLIVGAAAINLAINVHRAAHVGTLPTLTPIEWQSRARRLAMDESIQLFKTQTARLMNPILKKFAPAELTGFFARLDWLDEVLPQNVLEEQCGALLMVDLKRP